ncbi:MAG: efflux RND transporter periplasmic adaptor subunit [Magnetococcales bacterium]|nr:efflux RND transporter periplasmic adaptor subunit [Magnetococcales bacterium]
MMKRRIIVALALLLPMKFTLGEEQLLPLLPILPPPEPRAELVTHRHLVLSSDFAARILEIQPEEGQPFKQGQLLVRFDCALEKAQLERAKAQVKSAETKVAVQQRLSRLDATSRMEEELAAAEAATARAEMKIIQVRIDRCDLSAPFSGRVAVRMAQPHQYVKAGDPLMEILDPTALEAVFLLPSRQLNQLPQGATFKIHIDETATTYTTRVTATGTRIDPMSQSIKIVGRIDGHHPELLPGMSGRAILEGLRGPP